jgi:hypothetical protein
MQIPAGDIAPALQPEALRAVQEVTNELKYNRKKVSEKKISDPFGAAS